jgi:hypothetical protein
VSAPRPKLAAGSGSSVVVEACQICGERDLRCVLFLGYLPPVNQMRTIGEPLREQPAYPAAWLRCARCGLVQIGLVVDREILFPPEYPYSSGSTRILREDFAELHAECRTLVDLGPEDLVVDIGSNDGTLLENFAQGGQRVLGIEPTQMAERAVARGIPTLRAFFDAASARRARSEHGEARVITATNVLAHMEDVHGIVEALLGLLAPRGVFVSESHYLPSLLATLQYDTIYHEHLRYYSLASLEALLGRHGLEVIHCKPIPTHGGSIRVYAARKGTHPVRDTVASLREREARQLGEDAFARFRERVVLSKLRLGALLAGLKAAGRSIWGVGAPSRASTLVHYAGLDDGVIERVLEVPGSQKLGKQMPGTLIPVLAEPAAFGAEPDHLLLFSWHIADELMPKLRAKGFRGGFIVPLPEPRLVDGEPPR